MSLTTAQPLGYAAAKYVVELGRAAFFGSHSFDLPENRSQLIAQNDLVPQFGYVGAQFQSHRVILLGINSGNGHDEKQSEGDKAMMPALRSFASRPSPESFIKAQSAYRAVCQSWPMWGNHCSGLLADVGLSIDHIAYSNCLPWRTASQSAFGETVAERAAMLYALPFVEELKPKVIVALGKKAAAILAYSPVTLPPIVTWNRARAPAESVVRERREATEQLVRLLATSRHEGET